MISFEVQEARDFQSLGLVSSIKVSARAKTVKFTQKTKNKNLEKVGI